MSNLIGILVLLVLLAIPVTAIISVYWENIQPYAAKVARLLAFDPRHAAFGAAKRESRP